MPPNLDQLGPGSIVRAVPPGERGKGKLRPLVIISDPQEPDDAESSLVAVCISSTNLDLSKDTSIELPWHPSGQVMTGLKVRSCAVCDWLVELSIVDIDEIRGYTPPSKLEDILALVNSIQGDNPV